MVLSRISSLDSSYTPGMLSLFPEALDSVYQLYPATNNAITYLTQTISYNSSTIYVENTSLFPPNGILVIGVKPGDYNGQNYELVYYDNISGNTFQNLIRGFAGSRQTVWSKGSQVYLGVSAEYSNAVRDSLLNIQADLGTQINPSATSLNGILSAQETRFYTPRPVFRAYPTTGNPGTQIAFKNFSDGGSVVRYFWELGDGSSSSEENFIHTYLSEGIYTVSLNIVTSLGSQGIAIKSNYITITQVNNPYFYVTPQTGYSVQTATKLGIQPTLFNFIDQTDGDVLQRYWIFGGNGTINGNAVPNNSLSVLDPNIHFTSYIYDEKGLYSPSELVIFANQSSGKAFLQESIIVQ